MQIPALDSIIQLRHELHSHPDLSCEEQPTKERLIHFLNSHTSLTIHDCGSYFYAVYHTSVPTPRPPLAFRAEMDALPMEEEIFLPYASVYPGKAHKCGHDGHSAALAGFALMLEEYGADRDIYLIFQHGEEIGAGGMTASSCLVKHSIPMIYACHNWSGFPDGTVVVRSGPLHCASMGLTVRFTGSHAHASEPEHGRNPSSACSHLALYLEELAGASHIAEYESQGRGLVLATIVEIRVGAKDFGMSAAAGEVSATLRAEQESELSLLQTRIREKAAELASLYGLSLAFEESDVFPETCCTENAVAKIRTAANRLGYPVHELAAPIRASEDFGYFTKVADGAIFYLGNGEDYPNIHTGAFDFPDCQLERIIQMFYELVRI